MSDQCTVTDFDNQSLMNKVMDGGIGYGSICFPPEMGKYIILIATSHYSV